MRANSWRGEVELRLGNRLYVLCPTFEALIAIESELKTGIITLARKLASERITLDELAIIIAHTAVIGKCKSVERIGNDLLRGHVAYAMQSVARMFSNILGDSDADIG